MKVRRNSISRRQGAVMAGALAVLLASGGVAAAAATGSSTTKHHGATVSEAPGNPHPQHIKPGTAQKLRDLTVVEGGPVTADGPSVVEVPGAKPKGWDLGEATPVKDAPVVVGGEGNTTLR
ncbi:hypothetical protein SBI_01407 [Streptomyces bingchenggensis BCW-1]|uniref:Secreted protein n=1 Tax=Streptomyces bingchenggensis (strain BCW-1) TaxID=749414 RepID=D7CC33_STRBB|nr:MULTISPECIES: hypothetical protein [Streptomyces]ADI04528.1 hypothetical protein SBI_01407 [Streptomyces bingchenggensis BCW-1]